MKGQPSTFVLPLGPILPLLATALSVLLLIHAGFDQGGLAHILWGLGALVVGVPVYLAMRRRNGAAAG